HRRDPCNPARWLGDERAVSEGRHPDASEHWTVGSPHGWGIREGRRPRHCRRGLRPWLFPNRRRPVAENPLSFVAQLATLNGQRFMRTDLAGTDDATGIPGVRDHERAAHTGAVL